MNEKVIRIMFTGTPLISESYESFEFVLEKQNITNTPQQPKDGWDLKWKLNEFIYDLRLAKTSIISWLYYESVEEYLKHPTASDEINFLRNVDGIIYFADVLDNSFYFENLGKLLLQIGRTMSDIPLIFQTNESVSDTNALCKKVTQSLCPKNNLHLQSNLKFEVGTVESINLLIRAIEQQRKLLNYYFL